MTGNLWADVDDPEPRKHGAIIVLIILAIIACIGATYLSGSGGW